MSSVVGSKTFRRWKQTVEEGAEGRQTEWVRKPVQEASMGMGWTPMGAMGR